MFSGIIEELGSVTMVKRADPEYSLGIRAALFASNQFKLGDSVAISGVCLTLKSAIIDGEAFFDIGKETAERTTLGSVSPGDVVNIERPLLIGDRLHGHFVLGHVDGVGTIKKVEIDGNSVILTIEHSPGLSRFIAPQGAITVDGVSLTVAANCAGEFSVMIIPHTAHETSLGRIQVGQAVNLEVDCLARYVINAQNC